MSNRLDEKYITKIINDKLPNIQINKIYRKDNVTRIDYTCKVCGHKCNGYWGNMKRGIGCRVCGRVLAADKRRRYKKCDVMKDLNEKGWDWLNSDEYKNIASLIKIKCKKCGAIYVTTYHHKIIENTGCDSCGGIRKFSEEELINRVNSIDGYKFVKMISYNGSISEIKIRHVECGNEFNVIFKRFYNDGKRCNVCNELNGFASIGEREVGKFLDSINQKYIRQKTYDGIIGVNGGLLSYDFYLPDKNILIEYQGEQHEAPVAIFGGHDKFKVQIKHDELKREYAKENNINLIEIWYKDFKNIDEILRKEIL